jgi:predicted Zn-dependent protease
MRSLRQIMGRMGRLVLLLGVLGGTLLLGIVLSPWRRWSSAVEQPPPTSRPTALTEEATRALLTGNLPEARQRLEEALAQDPRHAPALLLKACLALEAADTQTAKTALEQLRDLAPERRSLAFSTGCWSSAPSLP